MSFSHNEYIQTLKREIADMQSHINNETNKYRKNKAKRNKKIRRHN